LEVLQKLPAVIIRQKAIATSSSPHTAPIRGVFDINKVAYKDHDIREVII